MFTPKACSQKWDHNEFIDRFKLLPINVQEIILQNYMENSCVVISNYILHVDIPQLSQYRKWLLVIVCILVLTNVERVVMINHIVSMKDEKDHYKPNINALIKWWVL